MLVWNREPTAFSSETAVYDHIGGFCCSIIVDAIGPCDIDVDAAIPFHVVKTCNWLVPTAPAPFELYNFFGLLIVVLQVSTNSGIWTEIDGKLHSRRCR